MGWNICFTVLVTVCLLFPYSSQSMGVNDYFPEIQREISRITWAHAVNNRSQLENALGDPTIMMIEADILMGTLIGSDDVQPIMAHPPSSSSDLTYEEFIKTVLRAIKADETKRKGIKLDFKEIDVVEPCLQILKSGVNDLGSFPIPVFINADILQGPVNSTKKPIDAERFISLAREYAPFAVLSVGWTTRYGTDDASDEIRDGKYTKQQMKEMVKVLKTYAGEEPPFPHITFPVRAGLAAQSIDELLFLTSRVRTDNSITIWSTHTDPVNRRLLKSLIAQTTARHCFVDLPFSILEDDDDDAEVIEGEAGISDIQHLEGRAQSEESMSSSAASSTSFLSLGTLLPVISVGIFTAIFIAYRRH